MTTPLDDPVERRLVPSDPLEVHGMKAGVSDHDHGAFRVPLWCRLLRSHPTPTAPSWS